ncbi:MAG: DUF169 domain-containing protein [Dehalococcoidia bacterium]
MAFTKDDIAVLDKFNFEIPPVSVKFSTRQPEGVERLDRTIAFCEMLAWAQKGNAFFVDHNNHTCDAGPYVLGMADAPAPFIGGEFGAGLQIFESPRSASRLYNYIPTLKKGSVNYIAFSPAGRLLYDPDVLILLTRAEQTEILLRAMSYRTGQIWESKSSAAIGCAWMYIYPYQTGKLNYFVAGLGHGMKRRKLFPEGMQIISIPFDLLPSMMQTLKEMPWTLPAYKPDGMEFVKQLLDKLDFTPPR